MVGVGDFAVTPRERRVSRNWKLVKEYGIAEKSRLARGV